MIDDMELSRATWSASIKLAAVVSVIAAATAVVATSLADVPQAAIVLPVIVLAFGLSWAQTARLQRRALDRMVLMPAARAVTRAA